MGDFDEVEEKQREGLDWLPLVVASASATLLGYVLGRGAFQKEYVQSVVANADDWCQGKQARSREAS